MKVILGNSAAGRAEKDQDDMLADRLYEDVVQEFRQIMEGAFKTSGG